MLQKIWRISVFFVSVLAAVISFWLLFVFLTQDDVYEVPEGKLFQSKVDRWNFPLTLNSEVIFSASVWGPCKFVIGVPTNCDAVEEPLGWGGEGSFRDGLRDVGGAKIFTIGPVKVPDGKIELFDPVGTFFVRFSVPEGQSSIKFAMVKPLWNRFLTMTALLGAWVAFSVFVWRELFPRRSSGIMRRKKARAMPTKGNVG